MHKQWESQGAVIRPIKIWKSDPNKSSRRYWPRGGRYKDRDRSMLNIIAICPEW
jgi:hypothetical protein